MTKPLLLIITGEPASGKTTLAHELSSRLHCPLLSRDEIKEGYVNTFNRSHEQMDSAVNWHVYETFFDAIELFIAKDISIIVEAAFQDKLWKPKLLSLADRATVKIILCNPTPEVARNRFEKRLQTDPGRKRFHGDDLHIVTNEVSTFLPLNMNSPTMVVDTTDGYSPGLAEIIAFSQAK